MDKVSKGLNFLMTEMFGDAWPPMSVPDLAPDDDDDDDDRGQKYK